MSKRKYEHSASSDSLNTTNDEEEIEYNRSDDIEIDQKKDDEDEELIVFPYVSDNLINNIPDDITNNRKEFYQSNSTCIEKEISAYTIDFLQFYDQKKNIIKINDPMDKIYKYKMIDVISEGTFGVVYKAKNKRTGEINAIKRLKTSFNKYGKPRDNSIAIAFTRELQVMNRFRHKNIVQLKELVTNNLFSELFMVMEYAEFDMGDLVDVMDSQFTVSHSKRLLIDLLQALHFLHLEGYCHRDIKMSNLLLNYKGELKLCDFGLTRKIDNSYSMESIDKTKMDLTPGVVTLWYRAPELLLGSKKYDTKVDIWAAACIFICFLTKEPPFPGRGELDQIRMIFKVFGSPKRDLWPEFFEMQSVKTLKFVETPRGGGVLALLDEHLDGNALTNLGISFIESMFSLNPNSRPTATELLESDFLKKEKPFPASRRNMMDFVAVRLRAAEEDGVVIHPDSSEISELSE